MTSSCSQKPPVGGLPYDLDYLTDDLIAKAQSEIFEDEDTRIHGLEQLKSLLREEKDLLWQDDELFLLSFLRARKFDVKRSFEMVKNMYKVMGRYKYLYYNFDFKDIQKAIDEDILCLLPYRDSEGSTIFLFRVARWNPEIIPLSHYILCFSMILHCAIRNPATQVAGFKCIVNFTGFTFKHLEQCMYSNVRLVVEILQNCFPGRMRAMHIVNQDRLFTLIWMMARPLMTKKFRERIHFHGEDLNGLHKFIQPNILPLELGGELPSANSAEWGRTVMESADYLSHVFSFGYVKYLKKDREKKEKTKLEKD